MTTFTHRYLNKKSIEQTDTFSGNEIESIKNAAFKAGVQFAEEWIDVNDELPENVDDVIVMDEMENYRIGSYFKANLSKDIQGLWSIYVEDDFFNVVKWRPINRKIK